jgi:RNA polymerase sigma-70 factor (ECF subfamily)
VTTAIPQDTFEMQRPRLLAVAYRILGSRTEAEDAVQETWLRWAAADPDDVRRPEAWLTTVCARICLDHLRSARVRREAYVGSWLPEPLVERLPDHSADPARDAVEHEQVSLALLVVMERMAPPQRVAFVLHDVFAVPFNDIATILRTSPEAARQMASRARRAVREDRAASGTADLAEQRRVVTAFFDAAQAGDLAGLIAVLDPEAVLVGDGGGIAPTARRAAVGAVQVARFMRGLFRRTRLDAEARLTPVLVNGDLGMMVDVRALPGRTLPVPRNHPVPLGETLRYVVAFAVSDGRIQAIYNQGNPAKLTGLPGLLVDQSTWSSQGR